MALIFVFGLAFVMGWLSHSAFGMFKRLSEGLRPPGQPTQTIFIKTPSNSGF